MPQLMPLYWIMSILCCLFIIVMMIFYYNVLKSYEMIMKYFGIKLPSSSWWW